MVMPDRLPGGDPSDWARLIADTAADLRRCRRQALALCEGDFQLGTPRRTAFAALAARLDAQARTLDALQSG
jgi:hypothetical protein